MNVNLPRSDERFFSSPFTPTFASVNNTIFEHRNAQQPGFAATVWCHLEGKDIARSGLDVIVHTQASTGHQEARVYSGQLNSTTQMETKSSPEISLVSQMIGNQTRLFSKEFNFDLRYQSSPNERQVAGTLTAKIDGTVVVGGMSCLVTDPNPALVPQPANLIAFYTFDDLNAADGAVVADGSHFAHDGVIHNPDGSGLIFDAGKFGKGLRFNGVDDYIDISSLASQFSNEMTVSFWFAAAPTLSKNYVIGVNTAARDNLMKVGFGKCSTIDAVDEFMAETPGACLFSGKKPLDDQWHHAVFTLVQGQSRLYLDGVLVVEESKSVGFLPTDLWSIGQEFDSGGPGDFYKGRLDEVMIWNRALTMAEILAL